MLANRELTVRGLARAANYLIKESIMSLKLIGAGLSPFVRKVRVALIEKGLEYEHDPMLPLGVSDDYKRLHPQGKVPLMTDGDRVIPDSSAICAYLEKLHPLPALYPSDAYEYARAIWYEEFGDGGLIHGASVPFQERVLAPAVFKRPSDEEKLRQAVEELLPPYFDYLERELAEDDYLVGNRFSIADISIGSQLVTFAHGKGEVDAARWPELTAYRDRVTSRPSFKTLIEEEQATLREMGA